MLDESLLVVSLIMLGFSVASKGQSGTMRVATYNIRFDNIEDIENLWSRRYPVIADLIRFHDFDIFGTQEALYHQLNHLEEALPQYSYIGVGRTDGTREGEFEAIFYRRDKFTLLKEGNFWFSLTPDTPGVGWDADVPRLCTWGLFQIKNTGFSFCFFNVHLEYRGKQARRESVKLLLQKAKQIAGTTPVILTGDFNFGHKDREYDIMSSSGTVRDAFELAQVRYASRGTFNAFGDAIDAELSQMRIDHIWLGAGFEVTRYGILIDSYNDGKFPSDHFPVVADVSFSG